MEDVKRRGPEGQEPQRQEAAELDEDPRKRLMQLAVARRAVQRKAKGPASPARIPQGGGAPLEGGARQTMEQHLGADLSAVKIHTGGPSEQAASDLNARAFTVGNDVHFNAGEFAPESRQGQKLLAHELTHVVQGQKAGVQRKAEEDAPAAPEEAKEEPQEEGAPAEALCSPEEALAAAMEAGQEADGDQVSSPDDPAEKEADQKAEELEAGGDGKAPTEASAPISAKPQGQIFRKLKPEEVTEKKQDLKEILSQIKTPDDLARKETILQEWEKKDRVLAKMIEAFREKLTGRSQSLTGVTPGKPTNSRLDKFNRLGDSPLGAAPEDPKERAEYDGKAAKREKPSMKEAMDEDRDRQSQQQGKLAGPGNEGTKPNDPHNDTSVAVDIPEVAREVGKQTAGTPGQSEKSRYDTQLTEALVAKVEKLLGGKDKVTMEARLKLKHELDGRIHMLDKERATALKKKNQEEAILEPQLEKLREAEKRLME